jgi:hypothetical protein
MKENLKTALLALSRESDKRSVTARVAEHFAEIEGALSAGVQRTAVLDTLARYGIALSLKNFDNILYRLRKKQAAYLTETKDAIPPCTATGKSELKGMALVTSQEQSDASPRQRKTSVETLPEDWMTAKLTPAQFRLLSPKQNRAKIDAETAQFFPNRFKPNAGDS